MACASCAARIERKLKRMEGVTATVNCATEKARISYGADMTVPGLIATVVATGYTAREPSPRDTDAQLPPQPDELRPLRDRLITAIVLSAPVVATAMVPARSSSTGRGCPRPSRRPPSPTRPGT